VHSIEGRAPRGRTAARRRHEADGASMHEPQKKNRGGTGRGRARAAMRSAAWQSHVRVGGSECPALGPAPRRAGVARPARGCS